MSNKLENVVRGKNIRNFTLNDTLYINKTEGGRGITYLCQFVKFKAGVVTAKVISSEHNNAMKEPGDIITANITKCALYGYETEEYMKKHNHYTPHYHWFQSTGDLKS